MSGSNKQQKVQRTQKVFASARNNVQDIKTYYREKRANAELSPEVAEAMEVTDLSRSNIAKAFTFKNDQHREKIEQQTLKVAELKNRVRLAYPRENIIAQVDGVMNERFGMPSQFNAVKKIYEKDDFSILSVMVLSKKRYEIFSVRVLIRNNTWRLDDESHAFFSEIDTPQNNKHRGEASKVYNMHTDVNLQPLKMMQLYSYEDIESICWLADGDIEQYRFEEEESGANIAVKQEEQ